MPLIAPHEIKRDQTVMEQTQAQYTGSLVNTLELVTQQHRDNGWGFGKDVGTQYVQYWCEECGGALTPGPSGAGTNQVCEVCKINYGCLPGGLER